MTGSNKTNISPSALHNQGPQQQDQNAQIQKTAPEKEAELKTKEQQAFAKQRLENQIYGPKRGSILNVNDESSEVGTEDKQDQSNKGQTWSGRVIDHINGV
jgi:hypothetical protein